MNKDKEYGRRYRNKSRHNYRGENGEIVVPAGVVDEEAYKMYVSIHEEMMNDPNVEYQTSDPELVVNLLGNVKYIRSKIHHLPTFERNKIEKITDRLRKMKAQCSKYKIKAFKDVVEMRKHSAVESKTPSSFLERRSPELIELFGRFFTGAEVHKIVNLEWGYDVSMVALTQFRTRHIEKIKERQEEFKRDYSDVRLGIKRSRLDELSYLFVDRKDIYKTGKHREDSKELRAILEQIRKEVEGDVLTIDGDISIKHEHRIQLQINNELMRGMSLKSLIIARVAAKLGRNPIILQHRLMNSYYAKLTGFQPAENSLATDQIIFPSQLIYDFDLLREKNAELEVQEAQIIESSSPPIRQEEKVTIEDVRMEIMKRLIEQRNINMKTVENMKGKKE